MLFDRPTIAVVITTHNRSSELFRALESIVKQTRTPDEVIVVDDCSDVEVETAVNENFQDVIPNLRFLRLSQGVGVSIARNIGCEQSHAHYVAFLDDDDTFCPHKIERVYNFILENGFPDLIYHKAEVFCENENCRYTTREARGLNQAHNIYLSNYIGGTSRVVCKKQALNSVGGFDQRIRSLEDWDLWIRLISCGAKVGFIDEVLITYYCKTKSSSLSKSLERREDGLEIIREKHKLVYTTLSKEEEIEFSYNNLYGIFWQYLSCYQRKSASKVALRLFLIRHRSKDLLLLLLSLISPTFIFKLRSWL